MAIFDWVVLGIVGFSAVVGAWRGLVGEALAILAWVLALLGAWLFGALVGDNLFAAIADKAIRTAAGFAATIVLVLLAMAGVRWLLRKLLKALGLGLTDRLLGFMFGVMRGTAVVLVLVIAAGLTSAPRMPWWSEAKLSPPFEIVALALRPLLPPDLAKRIRY